MKKQPVDVSFLIVNYKQEKDLKNLVNQISESVGKYTYEILVFNNSLKNKLNINSKATVKTYTVNKNIGYGAGINYLSVKAKGEYFIILNPDVSIKKGFDKALNEYIKTPLKYSIYSLGEKEKFYTIPLFSRFKSKYRFSSYAFLTHKDFFKSIGGFNIKYFMYFEDDDLVLKQEKFKTETFFPKNIYVTHNKTYKNISILERKYNYYSSLIIYLNEHYVLAYIILLLPLLLLKYLYSFLYKYAV